MVMTRPKGSLDRDRDVRPGMAHFFGSGPKGASCGMCEHFGFTDRYKYDQPKRCGEYYRLMGKVGAKIDSLYRACKYFKGKEI